MIKNILKALLAMLMLLMFHYAQHKHYIIVFSFVLSWSKKFFYLPWEQQGQSKMLCSNLFIKIIYLIDCLHHISQKKLRLKSDKRLSAVA